MARMPLVRIALVKFTIYGKSYVARCDREDIGVGSEVVVLMRARTPTPFLIDGVVTEIQYKRWDCSCRVLHLAAEDSGFLLCESGGATPNNAQTTHCARKEMAELYEHLTTGDAESVYLGDGTWLSSDGLLHERRA